MTTSASSNPPSAQPSPLAVAAVAGITDATLRQILADHWEHTMRWTPTWATTLGDHRYDDRLAPRDPASIAALHAEHDAILARAAALDPAHLGEIDRVTAQLLRGKLEAEHAMYACRFQEWNVDSANSPSSVPIHSLSLTEISQ